MEATGFVIYRKQFKVTRAKSKMVTFLFPETPHIGAEGNGGMSNSDLAENLVGRFDSPSGKWGEWFRGILREVDVDLTNLIESTVGKIYSDETRDARRKYIESLTVDEAREQRALQQSMIDDCTNAVGRVRERIRGIESEISRLRSTDYKSEAMRAGRTNAGEISVYASQKRLEANRLVNELERRLYSERSELDRAMSSTENARRPFSEISANVALRYSSSVTKSRFEHLRRRVRDLDEASRMDDADAIAEKLRDFRKPFSIESSCERALAVAVDEARSRIIDAFMRSKGKSLSEDTQRARAERGNDPDTPLFETGEFANSLVTVIENA